MILIIIGAIAGAITIMSWIKLVVYWNEEDFNRKKSIIIMIIFTVIAITIYVYAAMYREGHLSEYHHYKAIIEYLTHQQQGV